MSGEMKPSNNNVTFSQKKNNNVTTQGGEINWIGGRVQDQVAHTVRLANRHVFKTRS
jgi:hypothetical protein